MDTKETYELLLSELLRLTGRELDKDERDLVFREYIYSRIPDIEISKALKGKSKRLISVLLPEGLEFEPILKQTQKILTLMEVSDNWADFESLANKKKKPDKPKDLTDFDKILKGIIAVPKEDKPPQ